MGYVLERIGGNSTFMLFIHVLSVPIFTLYALAATGCISDSPSLPSLYLVSVRSQNESESIYEVRIGYFGLCSCIDNGHCICSSMIGSTNSPTTNLVDLPNATIMTSLAVTLRANFFVSLVAAAGAFYLVAVIAILLRKWHIHSGVGTGDRWMSFLRFIAVWFLWIAVGLSFTAAVSLSEAGPVLQFLSNHMENVLFVEGRSLAIIHWLIFGFSLIYSIGIYLTLRGEDSESECHALTGAGAFKPQFNPITAAMPGFNARPMMPPNLAAARMPPIGNYGPPRPSFR